MKILLENEEKADEINENGTSVQVGQKLTSRDKTKEEYGLSASTINRYLRIAELSPDFLELLDDGNLSVFAAVDLSYLPMDEQNLVYRYISDNGLRIDMKKAQEIRSMSKSKKLNEFSLPSVWAKKKQEKKKPGKTVKLNRKDFSEYFAEDDSEEEIAAIIKAALQFYYENSAGEAEDELEDGEDEEV